MQLPLLQVLAKKGCISAGASRGVVGAWWGRGGAWWGRGQGGGKRTEGIVPRVQCAHWVAVPRCQVWCQVCSEEYKEADGRVLLKWKNVTHTYEQNDISYCLCL